MLINLNPNNWLQSHYFPTKQAKQDRMQIN